MGMSSDLYLGDTYSSVIIWQRIRFNVSGFWTIFGMNNLLRFYGSSRLCPLTSSITIWREHALIYVSVCSSCCEEHSWWFRRGQLVCLYARSIWALYHSCGNAAPQLPRRYHRYIRDAPYAPSGPSAPSVPSALRSGCAYWVTQLRSAQQTGNRQGRWGERKFKEIGSHGTGVPGFAS
jgi:hypothetical protein